MQYRSLTDSAVEYRADNGKKTIRGYAAVYNSLSHVLDGYREIIRPGAFDRSLREVAEGTRVVSARVQHAGGLSTVGTTANTSLRLWSDNIGLGYEIEDVPDTNAGRDVVALVSGGYINKSSFAFTVGPKGRKWDWSTTPPTVELLDVDLIDVAPVDGPAYEATSVEMRNLMRQEIAQNAPASERPERVQLRELENGQRRVEIYIYDQIVPTWMSRYMSDTMSGGEVVEALEAIPDADGIDVYMNSPGGDVFEGLAIYNALRDHPAPVSVYVRGLAASAAALVAMAGDHIQMGEGSLMMIHNSWGGVMGNAREMRKTATILDKIDASIAGITAARTGQPEKQIARWMDAETWFTANEAVDYGLANRVGGPAAELTEEDGERCRKLNYRNIPNALGGPAIETRTEISADDLREAINYRLRCAR